MYRLVPLDSGGSQVSSMTVIQTSEDGQIPASVSLAANVGTITQVGKDNRPTVMLMNSSASNNITAVTTSPKKNLKRTETASPSSPTPITRVRLATTPSSTENVESLASGSNRIIPSSLKVEEDSTSSPVTERRGYIIQAPSGNTDGTEAKSDDRQQPMYVLMTPQELLQATQCNIVPQNIGQQILQQLDSQVASGSRLINPNAVLTPNRPTLSGSGVGSSQTTLPVTDRRISHNEVERRRRDKINTWIKQIGNLLPSANNPMSRFNQSKGNILEQTVHYLEYLKERVTELETSSAAEAREVERVKVEHQLLLSHAEELKRENRTLQRVLLRNGITVIDKAELNSSSVETSTAEERNKEK